MDKWSVSQGGSGSGGGGASGSGRLELVNGLQVVVVEHEFQLNC